MKERVVFENKKEVYKWVFPKAVFALYDHMQNELTFSSSKFGACRNIQLTRFSLHFLRHVEHTQFVILRSPDSLIQ